MSWPLLRHGPGPWPDAPYDDVDSRRRICASVERMARALETTAALETPMIRRTGTIRVERRWALGGWVA